MKNTVNFLLPGLLKSHSLTGKYMGNIAMNCVGELNLWKISLVSAMLQFRVIQEVISVSLMHCKENFAETGGGILIKTSILFR